MQCPNCNLINPPDALRCDCGYDFSSRGALTIKRVKLTEGASTIKKVERHWVRLSSKWTRLAPVRRIAVTVSIALLLAVLFPPFHLQIRGSTINLGYGFLFTPPMLEGESAQQYRGNVNAPMLAIEVAVILVIAGAAYLAVRHSN